MNSQGTGMGGGRVGAAAGEAALQARDRRFFLKKHASAVAIVAVFAVLGLVSSSVADFSFIKAAAEFPGGFAWFLVEFMPTAASFEHAGKILAALGSTVLDAVAAATLAAVFSYACAVAGSKAVGFGGPVQLVVRALASVMRNIPVVAWAFILLFSFKQSEFTGFLALFLKSFGFLTRSFMEVVDEMSQGPVEALRACGATRLQVIAHAVVPLSIPQVVSWTLYKVESNIRDATLVGMLTGTGIGFVFELYYRSFRYDTAGLVVICVALAVIVCETLSNFVRRRVIAGEAAPVRAQAPGARDGLIKTRTLSKPDVLLAATMLALAALTVFTFARMDFGDVNLLTACREAFGNLGIMALEPRLDGHFLAADLVEGLFVTLSIATVTTLGGAVLALVLGLLAACNLSNAIVSNAIKIVCSVVRAVPTILWVLIFTVAIGLGSEACVVGMMFHTVAFLAKAYSEAFEEVDRGVLDALRSTGATWWQVVAHAVFPEKINEMLSWTFIRFESNFVTAVVVAAIAGSGGIGYQLFLTANFYFDMHEVGLITYMCLAVSVALETVATKLRKRFIVQR